MLNFIQQKLIFKSTFLPDSYAFGFNTGFKEVFLKATDGSRLHGVHFKAKEAKGVILYLHGNARSLNYWGSWGEYLANTYRYDVVMMDYRGYGKSRGKRIFKSMLEDTRLFYNYCEESFGEDKITVFGRSLGGAFATYIAKQKNPDKLIVESSFTTLKEVVKGLYTLPLDNLVTYTFQNQDNVPLITNKTYFIHGTEDRLIPYEMGEKLYQLSGASQKELFPVEGAMHNDMQSFNDYFKALDTILG